MIPKELKDSFDRSQLWIDGEALSELIADNKLSVRELKIFLIIACRDWGGKEGVCRMSAQNFADILGCKRGTSQKMVRKLQELGYIQQIYRVKMHDSKVKSTTSWKQAALWNLEGQILRSYFKVSKHGFRGGKLNPKHKK